MDELLKRSLAELTRLRIELEATQWAMRYALEVWEKANCTCFRAWAVGRGLPDACANAIGMAIVATARATVQEFETDGMNSMMPIEVDLLDYLNDKSVVGRG